MSGGLVPRLTYGTIYMNICFMYEFYAGRLRAVPRSLRRSILQNVQASRRELDGVLHLRLIQL